MSASHAGAQSACRLSYSATPSCSCSSRAQLLHFRFECTRAQADLEAQGSQSQRSTLHVLLLPTVVINTNQYGGRLNVPNITRALNAGFNEATEPEVCLSGGLQEDNCAAQDHGCWTDGTGQHDACVDTFRGKTCRCPTGGHLNLQQLVLMLRLHLCAAIWPPLPSGS